MRRGTEHDRRPTADPSLVVKRYKRPAAGDPPPPPSELRPQVVLEKTVAHLLRLWQTRSDEPPIYRFLFVSDRLRAVQQDITVQGLHSAPLLAAAARFHLMMEFFFFGVADAAEQGFSAVQNRSLLCNALISALEVPSDGPRSLVADQCCLTRERHHVYALGHVWPLVQSSSRLEISPTLPSFGCLF